MNNLESKIEENIQDIKLIFPQQLTLAPKQLADLRGISTQTLLRERSKGIGPKFKKGTTIEYPTREIAKWLIKNI